MNIKQYISICFKNKSFKLLLIISVYLGIIFQFLSCIEFLSLCGGIQNNRGFLDLWFINQYYMSGGASALLVFIPIISTLTFSDIFITEKENGFSALSIYRAGNTKRKLNIIISSSVIGLLPIFVIIIVSLISSFFMLYIPNLEPINMNYYTYYDRLNWDSSLFPKIYQNSLPLYTFIICVLLIIYSWFSNMLSIVISMFINNKKLIVVLPFIIFTSFEILSPALGFHIEPIHGLFYTTSPIQNKLFTCKFYSLTFCIVSFLLILTIFKKNEVIS